MCMPRRGSAVLSGGLVSAGDGNAAPATRASSKNTVQGTSGVSRPRLAQPHHAPGDHQIDGEAGLQTVGAAQATVLDAAAAFERAMKHLDTPSQKPL